MAQNEQAVKILGIDPGIANTGFGVVEAVNGRTAAHCAGVITTRANLPIEQRVAQIFSEIEALIEEQSPSALALEDLYFGQNATSAMAVGQARGVVLLAAGRRGIAVASYTPQQIKQAVCGHGRADKRQVQTMVQSSLGAERAALPDHAADALAAAVCHINHAPMAAALAGAR